MTDNWNPAQYNKFRSEREQPFFDLLALVRPKDGMRVVDLGCGTGAVTRLAHERLRAQDTLGIDRSPRMLEAARHELPAGLRFEVGTIESFSPEAPYDLILSNAAFHWVERHDQLIPRLARALAPGGQLAFQIPASHDQTSHIVAEELTQVEPFHAAFAGWHRPQPVLTPEEYARLLYSAGFVEQHVRLVVYPHVLESADAVVEWMKGTLLTEYEKHLPSNLFGAFVDQYRGRLLARLDSSRPYFFPFKRILCWGRSA
jgi:trans-aconitate 2-methyltransferase